MTTDAPSDNSEITPARARLVAWKVLAAAGFGLAVAFLVAMNALLVWVATGPRSLAPLIPYIESSFGEGEDGFRVKVGQGLLLWDGWRHPVDIRLRGVDIFTAQGVRFASFPDVSVGVDVFALALGRIVPTSLVIHKPVISLFQDEAGHVSFGTRQEDGAEDAGQGVALAELFAAFSEHEGPLPLARLKQVEVTGASVSLGNVARGVVLSAQGVDISMHRGLRGPNFHLRGQLQQEASPPGRIEAELSMRGRTGGYAGRVEVQSLWPVTLAPLAQEARLLPALQFPVSGWAEVEAGKDGAVLGGRYVISAGKGAVRAPWLEEPVELERAQLQGSVKDAQTLSLESIVIALGAYTVEGSAVLTRAEAGLGVSAQLSAAGVPLEHVRKFWPRGQSPLSREWVTENVRHGTATRAGVQVNIPPGGLAQKELPQGAIDAKVEFENAEVRFLPEHPPLKNGAGTLHITEKVLEGTLRKATYMGGTQLEGGTIGIADLNLDNPRIEVSFAAQAQAADVVAFLSLPPVENAKRLGLDAATASGSVNAQAQVGFYFFAPLAANGKPREDLGVDYAVKGQAADVGQPGFLGKFDISAASGKMEVNNTGLHFEGSGAVNGAVARRADISYRFTPEKGVDTRIEVEARAPVSALARFGYPPLPFLSGAVDVSAKLEQGPALEHSQASVQLKDAGIDWPEMGWSKPPGQPAKLELTAEKAGAVQRITAFTFTGADASARGSMELDAASEIQALTLEHFRLPGSDAAVEYARIPGGHRFRVRGAQLNLGGFMKGSNDFAFSTFPALELQVDLERLALGEGRALKALKGSLHCSRERCERADLTGTAAEKPFAFRITPGAGGRKLEASAADAGAFLRSVDLYDNMKGGELELSGSYDDGAPAHPLTGTLSISQHSIENAPVLTRLLSLASLTGLVDVLEGKGIAFTRLRAPFTLEGDVITLNDAKTFGPAMGLTAEGTIAFPGQKLELKGTVVPSYSLNTVFRNVPILGAITGGAEGIFAARYTMNGPADDPAVSVNPLSILTPGFLRGLFDVMDTPKDAQGK